MLQPCRLWLACWVACWVTGGAAAQTQSPPPAQALAAYVAKPDATFAWRIQRRYEHKNAEVLELHLESQTWQGTLWKHQLLIIRPKRVKDPGHALLIVGGGRWRDSYDAATDDVTLPAEAELFVAMARVLRSTVVVLGQVPFQPLFDLSEDRLIAYTFDRYLATGDTEWPLLLPMVKSVVRAMDAGSAAASREWGAPLERFTVLGGSKRGWTTWLAAAIEPRVTALVPVVIDALNMARHFPHQTEVWGAPSEEIRPYTDLNLTEALGSSAGTELRQIVDPWSYRATITQPKLVVLATNDAYFPLDSANLYWDGLVGPKYLLYVPNEPHSIKGFGPVLRGLRAVHAATAGGKPLPELAWEYVWGPAGVTLCVRSAPEPRQLRVWRAESADRDFRDATWSVATATGDSPARFSLARPASGYVGTFVEASYRRGLRAFALSTNLAVLPAATERSFGTEPQGEPGVCAAGPSVNVAIEVPSQP